MRCYNQRVVGGADLRTSIGAVRSPVRDRRNVLPVASDQQPGKYHSDRVRSSLPQPL